MELNEPIKADCPCKRTRCSRHGHCSECQEHHAGIKGKPTACMRSPEQSGRERRSRGRRA